MKPNELRIGNWCESPYEKLPFKIKAEHILELEKGMDECSILGIPLTPEILVKAGWVWNEECKSFEGKDVRMNLQYREVDSSFTMFNYVLKAVICRKIFYLHQLQNLTYALTGEELNIQL
jgi:hypothetical protein